VIFLGWIKEDQVMRTKAMKKMEEAGWIFASNGKAFVGVKFLVLQRHLSSR
jgi:hypothetical protein